MYRDRIRTIVPIFLDPRHVEAFMRAEHGTLDGLSPERFRAEALLAGRCVMQAGGAAAEKLALSYGLRR